MASRRKFSDEYKREAVRLAIEPGVTKRQVGRELGINANMLSRWCRDYSANGGTTAARSTSADRTQSPAL
jgi:transposase